MHTDRKVRPQGRGWVWNNGLSRWVWKSFPDLHVEANEDGSLRYMGWDYGARSGKGEWYELPEFERTEWVFHFLAYGYRKTARALTREQCNRAMREDRENGFYLTSWQVNDRDGNAMWIGFMNGISTGRVIRVYEYVYSPGEKPTDIPVH
ncbi:hypothetical protein AB0465_18470 [Streptomyces griseoviridis]|uniref:hypothetical protein n=1 Tax=Streptomyces griseoviridis TaxID=45398 RepID=UPI00344CEB5F